MRVPRAWVLAAGSQAVLLGYGPASPAPCGLQSLKVPAPRPCRYWEQIPPIPRCLAGRSSRCHTSAPSRLLGSCFFSLRLLSLRILCLGGVSLRGFFVCMVFSLVWLLSSFVVFTGYICRFSSQQGRESLPFSVQVSQGSWAAGASGPVLMAFMAPQEETDM